MNENESGHTWRGKWLDEAIGAALRHDQAEVDRIIDMNHGKQLELLIALVLLEAEHEALKIAALSRVHAMSNQTWVAVGNARIRLRKAVAPACG